MTQAGGYTIDNFNGFTGLSITIQATGSHTNAAATISGAQFNVDTPSANNTANLRFIFDFTSTGAFEVAGLNLNTSNNIFGRNLPGSGFQAR